MRDDALEPADLNDPRLKVVDVGGGTGFTTLGIVKYVDAKNITILDQSPHKLAKAKQKPELKECTIIEGDAEDHLFPTDYADRYVSAGSIEYWPDPQRGIKETYRVLKIGGKACVIGPVYPTFWLSRSFADVCGSRISNLGLLGGDGTSDGDELAVLDLSLARDSLEEGCIRCAAAADQGASTSGGEEDGSRETIEEREWRPHCLHSKGSASSVMQNQGP